MCLIVWYWVSAALLIGRVRRARTGEEMRQALGVPDDFPLAAVSIGYSPLMLLLTLALIAVLAVLAARWIWKRTPS